MQRLLLVWITALAASWRITAAPIMHSMDFRPAWGPIRS